jgi:hypothetical protein
LVFLPHVVELDLLERVDLVIGQPSHLVDCGICAFPDLAEELKIFDGGVSLILKLLFQRIQFLGNLYFFLFIHFFIHSMEKMKIYNK